MRIFFGAVFVTVFFSIVAAQIPNNGFEAWTNMGNYNDPNQWGTLNSITSFDGVYTCIKATPGNPGASYLMLRSETVTGLGVVPGIAVTGTINTTNYSVQGGFPFTQRPQNLTSNWQFMSSSGTDFGFISVYLTKWNTTMNVRDTISKTVTSLTGMVMSWSPFSIYLTYDLGLFPDTAQIVLSASGSTPYDGDYLYVDNLAFAGSVAGVESNSIVTNLNIYPNPVLDYLNVTYENVSGEQIEIDLMDIVGKKVTALYSGMNTKKQEQKSFDIRKISKGVYWIKISGGGKSSSRKIIII